MPTKLFQVREIAGKKVICGKPFYKIMWMGYTDQQYTWEPLQHLYGCRSMLLQFETILKAQRLSTPIKTIAQQNDKETNDKGYSEQKLERIEMVQGSIEAGDVVRNIRRAYWQGNKIIKYKVNWMPRKDGTIPWQSSIQKEILQKRFPQTVIKFLQEKISWQQ